MKLDIQRFSETQILSGATGGSSPQVTYNCYVEVSNRTSNSVDLSFRINASIGSSASFGSTSHALLGYFVVNGTHLYNDIMIHDTWESWGSGYSGNYTKTYTLTGIDASATSLTCRFYAYRDGVDKNRPGSFTAGWCDAQCSNITIPIGHIRPTLDSVVVTETNPKQIATGIAGNVFIPNVSIKTFTINATAYEGATISKYRVLNITNVFPSTWSTSNVITTDFTTTQLKIKEGYANFGINVEDSMGSGFSPTPEFNYTYIPYTIPTFTETECYVRRKGQLSGLANVSLSGTFTNGVFGSINQASNYKPTIKYKQWKLGDTEPSTYNHTISSSNISVNDGVFSVTNVEIGAASGSDYLDPNYAYRFKFFVEDNFTSSNGSEKAIPVGEPTWVEYKDRVTFKRIFTNGKEIRPRVYDTTETIVGEFLGDTLYNRVYTFSAKTISANTWSTLITDSTLNAKQLIRCTLIRGTSQILYPYEADCIGNVIRVWDVTTENDIRGCIIEFTKNE